MARFSKLHALFVVLLFQLNLQSQWSFGLQRDQRRLYIVYLGERQHEDADLVTASHHDILTSILGSKEETLKSIVYSYRHGFSGFSAMLTQSQAREIAALPGVLHVKENQIYNTHTSRSWDFLGLDYKQTNGLLAKARYGEDVIIGVVDSGITPESLSFDDAGYGPPPSKWKGICQVGPSFGTNSCNRKIIGARWYAYDVPNKTVKQEILSPRDVDGHGTHTASTAGGNIVHNVSLFGLAAGTVHGGAPRARLAIYKACWATSLGTRCSGAGLLKAMDDAVHDGVDVLSLSLGGPFEDPGTLHVVASGISVVYSAGNDGPIAQTVENSSPWLLTVAAATIDRSFPVVITLGNNEKFVAQSFVISGKSASQFSEIELYEGDDCDANNIDSTVKGKIVFCFLTKLNPAVDFYNISKIVGDNGGTGVILSQYNTDSLLQDVLLTLKTPFVPVDYEIAYKIYQYIITSDDTPKAKISLTRTTTGSEVSAPKVAAFSSRGPSSIYPGVLKPDIAAPGVSILAAAPKTAFYSSAPYHFASGTSMSCPHVSGIIAVLKSLHPEWSPAALKSAIMTTATTFDNNGMPIQANGYIPKIADPFDYGAGFVNPTMAADPGLIYDINPSDYLKFFNCIGGLGSKDNCTTEKGSVTDLNLPSIAIPNLRTSETAVRTVTNVGDQHDAVYKAFFETPAGVEMTVEPSVLVFSNEKKVQSFKVTFKATCKVQGDYTFGSLAWHDGGSHWVRIPIAVRVVIDEIYSKIS